MKAKLMKIAHLWNHQNSKLRRCISYRVNARDGTARKNKVHTYLHNIFPLWYQRHTQNEMTYVFHLVPLG